MKTIRITKAQARDIGDNFKINFGVVPFNEWHDGLNIELEHGSKLGKLTNVTGNDVVMTAKIAMAHLIEDPRYYYFLRIQEAQRDLYYKTHPKPWPFL